MKTPPTKPTVRPSREGGPATRALRPGQTIVVIGALVVVTAVMLCGYFVTSLYQSEVSAIRNRLEIPAHAMAHSTQAIALNADAALRHIQAALRTTGEGELATAALRQIMLYRDNVSISISRIAIYDAGGKPLVNSGGDAPPVGSVARYDFFRRQVAASTDRLVVSDLIPDPIDGKPEIALSRRLADSRGDLIGVAVIYIDAGYLQRIFDSLQMPPGTSITVFNRDGHMVVRMPPVHLGDAALARNFSHLPIFAGFRDGSAAGSFARFKTIPGIDRFIAGVGGKGAIFVVAAGWDSDAALASWRADSLAIAGGTFAAVVGALALLIYLRRQICRNDALLAEVSLAEQRQRNLMEALPDAVAIVDDTLAIEFANPAAEAVYGYGRGEMNGLALTAITVHSDKDNDIEALRLALAGEGRDFGMRVRQRTAKSKTGAEFPVEITSRFYCASNGSKLISVIRDMTAREANDLALRRSRENLARAQSLVALGSFDRDLTTGSVDCSDEFLRIWGLDPSRQPSPAELIDRVHPEDRAKFIESRDAVLQGHPASCPDFRIIRRDGEARILHHEYDADFDANGSPIRLFGIVQDVTERKAGEMALRRSQENLARAQRVAAIGSFDHDLITARSEWSEEFLKIWGITETPQGDTVEFLTSLIHPDDRQKFLMGREAAINHEPIPPLDFRITRPNGEIRILHREDGVIFDDQGRAVRLFGTVQDITERKTIENELRRSREDLARAQKIAGIGSFSRELATGKTEWSDEFLRVWGIAGKLEFPTAEALSEMVHPDDRAAFLGGRNVALHNVSGTSLDFRVTRPDGEERILHREFGVVFDENGKAARMFGTVQDVTVRKRIEIELRRHRENLAHSQRIAGIGSFERDLVTGKSEWSDELYRIHGVDRDDPRVGIAYLRSLIHPEDIEKFDEVRTLSAQGITAPPIDIRIIRPDGVERILHRECELVRDADGMPVRLVATMQDITERSKVEIELRRSRQNMVRAQSLAAIGSFDRDLVTGTIEWTDELYRILGFDPEKPRPAQENLRKLVHPEDRERFGKAWSEELAGKPLAPFEYRIIRADGVERLVRRESKIVLDAEGRVIRIFGTLQDITERKRVELEMTQSRENMLRAQRIANMGSFDHDFMTGRTEWSDQMYRIMGMKKGEASPSSDIIARLVHPDDRARFLASRARTAKPKSESFEFRIIRPDGEERVLRRESDVHYAEDGRLTRMFGTVQDITERRGAEARERELERQLLHSQKLEALGTLAGGIAHDLNNTLVPIMALSKLTARRFEHGNPVRANLDTIFEASERARDLVRRVLAFSRKDEPEQHEANLGDVVREALKLMRATVPTSIQLDAAIADVPPIRADGSQIHQVITNLVSNAAGALTGGMGTITVSLGVAARVKGANEVCLSVADTGCGMDEATQQRMFEPFFTTKAVGQGTGLGLSIVHGIVASHGGHVEVKSAPGKGTRFDLYFPLPAAELAEAPAARASRPAA
ncbi:MAG TPA: PAS domain-containing protein [Stellaceae bacterium]|nr:PAS domain-containing protein [Stellaceae bacterium]